MEYDLLEPWKTLDPWQKDYIAAVGNCFLLCGRQSGKTTAMSIKFGNRAALNKNRTILMLAFTEKQAYNLFFKTLMYLRAVYPSMIVSKGARKPTKHVINLTNGSKIMCYAAGLTGEGIRTFTVTDLVIDEAAPMAREVFVATTPMLSVTKGNIDISSTPRGKQGYFYECSDDESLGDKILPNFTRFYVSAENCPRHSKEFLEAEKVRMTKLEYAQEYLAMFLDEVRQFFPTELIKQRCIGEREGYMQDHDYYLGVDIARMGEDESTFEIIRKIDNDNLIHVESVVTKHTLLTETTKKIFELNEMYKFRQIFVDDGGMGVGVFDQLLSDDRTKRKVIAINNEARPLTRDEKRQKRLIKPDLFNNLLGLMERKEITLLDDDEVILSLKSIQAEYDGVTGKLKIWGNYAHITDGLIRAAYCAKDKSLNIWVRWR